MAITLFIYLPFAAGCYLAPTQQLASLMFLVPAILGGTYIGVGFAIIQSQVSNRMRATAAAINLFILNIIGLGLGPFTVGYISDQLAPTRGVDSLRYGLLAMVGVMVWAIFHYFRVGQFLNRQQETEAA